MKFLKKLSLYISVLVMAISVSSVVYAGFSRQYTPEVKGFGITVATQENMLISTTGDAASFSDMVRFEDLVESTDSNLQPLNATVETTDNEYTNLILKDGSDNTIYNSRTADTNVNVNDKYIAFNLYFIGSSDMNLYLGNDYVRNIITLDENATASLSFSASQKAALLSSMRIAFLTYATTYPEDYTGTNIRYSESPVSAHVYATSETTDTYVDYMFTQVGYNTTTREGTILADTTKNEITKIKVVIWLEGANIDTSILTAIACLKFNIAFQAVID